MSTQRMPQHVVVVPRNGYANRLQAWACASVFADDVGADLAVLWEPEAVAAATLDDLFEVSPGQSTVVTSQWFRERFGQRHEDLPRYLSVDPSHDVVVLAGHDRGEQAFMSELSTLMNSGSARRTLVIIAGGLFSLPNSQNLVKRRADFYRDIFWSSAVEERTTQARKGRSEYVALHVRHTDRSREAPTDHAVHAALKSMLRETGLRDLYIAADTAAAAWDWQSRAQLLGYEPWTMPNLDRDRATSAGGIDALAEWRLLGGSRGIVYPAASTYSTEAAVASGSAESAWGLRASPGLQVVRAARDLATSVLTWPHRRGGTP